MSFRQSQRVIPNGMRKVFSHDEYGIEIYIHESKFDAIGFAGKGSKPVFYHYYPSEQVMTKRITDRFNMLVEYYDNRKKQKEAKKELQKNFSTTLKEGDVLNGTWGYEQTNQEVFRVVKVLGPRSVIIARPNLKNEYTHFLQGTYHLLSGYIV